MAPPVSNQVISPSVPGIAEDVLRGLMRTPKALPPKLFYDAAGSALFEQITELPEYYLTRAERSIFEQYGEEIVEQAGRGLTIVELGSGTAAKTTVLLRALLRRQLSATFYPVDVAESALRLAEANLSAALPGLRVRPILGDFSAGLARLAEIPGQKLVLYIGSSIGNFEPEAAVGLLRSIRDALNHGDALLLGTDRIKEAPLLNAAYNDAAGVTARFNLNLLRRINRELGANFNLEQFRHVAEWNQAASRIEMYLESRRDQIVRVPALGLKVRFIENERMHTENSYKYTPQMVQDLIGKSGFELERSWSDDRKWFGVHLARV